MSIRVREALMRELGQLRYEPIDKRIRATVGEQTIVDSTRAMLAWEPRRIVPSYAIPAQDIDADIVPMPEGHVDPVEPELAQRPVLSPAVPFAAHTADAEPVLVRGRDGAREAQGLRVGDGPLAGHILLDFRGFDAWYEEDERNLGHPRDPFHRIDILHASRHVRVERDGVVLAESRAPYILFEPPLPVRYYLPRADVALDALHPSDTTSICAYKGVASYWSLDGAADVAWTYREPLREAAEITDRIAFFNEHVDITVDGVALDRPQTEWSRGVPAQR